MIRELILKKQMSYGILGYAVPHTIYPDGYHADGSHFKK
jgi:hypothetical protein